MSSSALAESNLLENSPFLPPGNAAPGAGQSVPLELRSIVKADGQYEFSLYSPAKKESTWVGLNEAGHDFIVKEFDVDHDSVLIEQRGRVFALVLKDARIAPVLMSTPAPSEAPGVQGRSVNDPAAAMIAPHYDQATAQSSQQAANAAQWSGMERRQELSRQRGAGWRPNAPDSSSTASGRN